MILPIYLYGQPVLRRPTEDLEPGELDVKQLVSDMQETLLAAEGCGLAAPQVGLSKRLFVVDGTELADEYPECKDFKPEIIEESEDTSVSSIPRLLRRARIHRSIPKAACRCPA